MTKSQKYFLYKNRISWAELEGYLRTADHLKNSQEMISYHDWARVFDLHIKEALSVPEVAQRLGMTRTRVSAILSKLEYHAQKLSREIHTELPWDVQLTEKELRFVLKLLHRHQVAVSMCASKDGLYTQESSILADQISKKLTREAGA